MISATPSAFAFTGTASGTTPAQQTVTFVSTPATSLPFTNGGESAMDHMSATSGTTKAILQFGVNITGMTAGTYNGQVLVTPSGAGNPPMTIPVSLTLTTAAVAPSISTQPTAQSVTVGQTATFSVAAAGTAPLSYRWNKNGVAISGANAASYTTPATVIGDNGAQFTVTVSNSTGTVISNAALLTVAAPSVAPSISTQPAGQSVTVGQAATFSVTAAGTTPLAYQWNKNGAAISGATSTSYTTPATVIGDNGAQFSVTVSNTKGSVSSNGAVLNVAVAVVAPSITGQPSGQSVTAGQTATFTVTASGTAPLTYQWSKNGTVISGATATSYTTPASVVGDNGAQFAVTVSNTKGNATSNVAVLNVAAPAVAPSITGQPISQTVSVGQTRDIFRDGDWYSAVGISVEEEWCSYHGSHRCQLHDSGDGHRRQWHGVYRGGKQLGEQRDQQLRNFDCQRGAFCHQRVAFCFHFHWGSERDGSSAADGNVCEHPVDLLALYDDGKSAMDHHERDVWHDQGDPATGC